MFELILILEFMNPEIRITSTFRNSFKKKTIVRQTKCRYPYCEAAMCYLDKLHMNIDAGG